MKLPEKERQALLRFAVFESKQIEGTDDTTLVILHAGLTLLRQRDPKRVDRIVRAAASLVDPTSGAPHPLAVAEVSLALGRIDADDLASLLASKGFEVELVKDARPGWNVHWVREKSSGAFFVVTQDGWVVRSFA